MIIQILLYSLIAAGSYALVGLGLGLARRTFGFFHLAHGAVFAIGPYIAFYAIHICNMATWIGITMGIVGASFVGLTIELLVYWPLRRRGASGTTFLIASLGCLIVLQSVIALFFGKDVKVLRAGPIKEGIDVFGARITELQCMMLIVCGMLLVGTWIWLHHSRLGQIVRAVANDVELSRCVGIRPDLVNRLVMIVASSLAATAGILTAYDTDLYPTMGWNALLMGVVVVVVGGSRSILGIALAALLVGVVQQLSADVFATQWQDAFVFITLLLFLIFKPRGVFE